MLPMVRISFCILTVLFVAACRRKPHSAAETTVFKDTQAAQERTRQKANDDVNAAMYRAGDQNSGPAATGHTKR
jgi:hypothetical protein